MVEEEDEEEKKKEKKKEITGFWNVTPQFQRCALKTETLSCAETLVAI